MLLQECALPLPELPLLCPPFPLQPPWKHELAGEWEAAMHNLSQSWEAGVGGLLGLPAALLPATSSLARITPLIPRILGWGQKCVVTVRSHLLLLPDKNSWLRGWVFIMRTMKSSAHSLRAEHHFFMNSLSSWRRYDYLLIQDSWECVCNGNILKE